jgi:hypothetical protein
MELVNHDGKPHAASDLADSRRSLHGGVLKDMDGAHADPKGPADLARAEPWAQVVIGQDGAFHFSFD